MADGPIMPAVAVAVRFQFFRSHQNDIEIDLFSFWVFAPPSLFPMLHRFPSPSLPLNLNRKRAG